MDYIVTDVHGLKNFQVFYSQSKNVYWTTSIMVISCLKFSGGAEDLMVLSILSEAFLFFCICVW